MKRWIMHVDMDAFYASVEQNDHPEYRDRPLIVGGLSARGVVATCSYEARAFGVRSAMSISKAKQLCPHGIFIWPRMERYKEVSEIIHKVMEHFTPYIEPLSLDEAYLDISGMGKLYKGPLEVGKAIKREIFEATGLIASVGIGSNKFMAKLASDLRKPDGLVLIPHGKEADMIKDLPISRLWGVGKELSKRLHGAGFQKIGQIAALPNYEKLIPYCGNQSESLYLMAKGIDERPIEHERQIQSVGNELTYAYDLTDPHEIDREWRYFSNRVAKRLRKYKLKGHTIAIKVRLPNFQTFTRQKRIDAPTDREDVLYEVSQLLYNKLGIYGPFRLLGITVSGFDAPVVEDNLFTHEEDQAKEVLTHTLDALDEKFGVGTIMKGSLWQRKRLEEKIPQANAETTYIEEDGEK